MPSQQLQCLLDSTLSGVRQNPQYRVYPIFLSIQVQILSRAALPTLSPTIDNAVCRTFLDGLPLITLLVLLVTFFGVTSFLIVS